MNKFIDVMATANIPKCEICQENIGTSKFTHGTQVYDQLSKYWSSSERASCLMQPLIGKACKQCLHQLNTCAYFVRNYHERMYKFHEKIKPGCKDLYLRNRCMICLHKRPVTQHLSLKSRKKNEEMYRRFGSILDFEVEDLPNNLRIVCLYCKDMLRQTEKLERRILEAEIERYKAYVPSIQDKSAIANGFHKLFGFNRSFFENCLRRKSKQGKRTALNFARSSESHEDYQKIISVIADMGEPKPSDSNASLNNIKKFKKMQVVRSNDKRDMAVLFFRDNVHSQDSVLTQTSNIFQNLARDNRYSDNQPWKKFHSATNASSPTEKPSVIPRQRGKSCGETRTVTNDKGDVKKVSMEELEKKIKARRTKEHANKSLDKILDDIQQRQVRRTEERKKLQEIKAKKTESATTSPQEETVKGGYDVFNVEDGIDVKHLVTKNLLLKRQSFGETETFGQSTKCEEREVTSNESFSKLYWDKKSSGTKSDMLSRRRKEKLIVVSNTLDNIPTLNEDISSRKSVKKAFTVPTR